MYYLRSINSFVICIEQNKLPKKYIYWIQHRLNIFNTELNKSLNSEKNTQPLNHTD